MSSSFELTNTWAVFNLIGIIAIIVMVAVVIYWVATGTDYYSVDNKRFEEAKTDCNNLKSYILDHYGSYNYDKAKERYSFLCK